MNKNSSLIIDEQQVAEHIKAILQLVNTDSEREGFQETPKRYAKFLREFLQYEDFNVKVFDSEGYDEMITQSDIPFYSLCEHHLVPFFGTATVSYIPGEKIVGLSKLARVVTYFSRRFQNQERITSQIAQFLQETLQPKGVGVTLTARHLCMEMRGVEKPGAQTTTTSLKGLYKNNSSTRAEFLSRINR